MLPLLKPITTTIAILHSLWIWNDFLLPLITLSSKKNLTIPLASSVYFGAVHERVAFGFGRANSGGRADHRVLSVHAAVYYSRHYLRRHQRLICVLSGKKAVPVAVCFASGAACFFCA
ncbi:hypothetical protein [Gordoniibacillus kamchatkensis]|uniref:hypothetical protein n=1 Tax=Gordoniibacillus kamchatkensis TaxID=1590651 RepID=UPI002F42A580